MKTHRETQRAQRGKLMTSKAAKWKMAMELLTNNISRANAANCSAVGIQKRTLSQNMGHVIRTSPSTVAKVQKDTRIMSQKRQKM